MTHEVVLTKTKGQNNSGAEDHPRGREITRFSMSFNLNLVLGKNQKGGKNRELLTRLCKEKNTSKARYFSPIVNFLTVDASIGLASESAASETKANAGLRN